MEIPKLYKYRHFNEKPVSKIGAASNEKIPQWQQVLFDGILFAAAPQSFNDPYDCDFVVENSFLNEVAARKMMIDALEKYNISEQDKNRLLFEPDWKKVLEDIMEVPLSESLGKTLMQVVDTGLSEAKDNYRVICLSETAQSILMWSHYAQNHTGFCIEYDFNLGTEWLHHHLHPVQYSKNRKQIRGSFANADNAEANAAIHEATLWKSIEWSYEREWRFVFDPNDLIRPLFPVGKYAFNMQPYISAVYLGTKTDASYCKQVCEHFCGTNVKVFKMKMEADSYKLQAEQIQ